MRRRRQQRLLPHSQTTLATRKAVVHGNASAIRARSARAGGWTVTYARRPPMPPTRSAYRRGISFTTLPRRGLQIPAHRPPYRLPAPFTIRATNSAGTDDWTSQRIATVAPPTLLVLADSDDTGLDVDAKALLVASAPGTAGSDPYVDSDRGGTDTPLDGELGLSATNTVISRFRRLVAAELTLNDNDSPAALDIGAYFNAGGDGADLTIYLQTLDGAVSFTAAAQFVLGGGGFARFTLPADAQTLLNNLGTGDRWIFKAARPATVTPTDQPVTAEGRHATVIRPFLKDTDTEATDGHRPQPETTVTEGGDRSTGLVLRCVRGWGTTTTRRSPIQRLAAC